MNSLHKAIKQNDLPLFTKLLSSPGIDVNRKNKKGRTPLLYCLKLRRSDYFIMALLESKCNVILYDQNGTTPLYIALTHRRLDIASQIMKMGADLAEDLKISNKYLCDAIRIRDWNFVWFLLNHEPNLVEVFLRGLQSRKVELDDNFGLFAMLTELDSFLRTDSNKKWYNRVGLNLVQYSLGLINSDIFKLIWPRLDHQCIFNWEPTLLKRYLNFCIFSTDDFVDCLYMILTSPRVSALFNFYKTNMYKSFFFDFLNECVVRDIEVEHRMMCMRMSFRFISVDILDILVIYSRYGISRETLFLIEHFQRESLTNNECHQSYALEFLKKLEKDVQLKSRHLKVLKSIAIVNFKFSGHWFDKTLLENVCLKRKLPKNQVPSLFELSTEVSQKHLQNFYKLRNPEHFQKTTKCLLLPESIKTRLCFKIPISYN